MPVNTLVIQYSLATTSFHKFTFFPNLLLGYSLASGNKEYKLQQVWCVWDVYETLQTRGGGREAPWRSQMHDSWKVHYRGRLCTVKRATWKKNCLLNQTKCSLVKGRAIGLTTCVPNKGNFLKESSKVLLWLPGVSRLHNTASLDKVVRCGSEVLKVFMSSSALTNLANPLPMLLYVFIHRAFTKVPFPLSLTRLP